MKLKPVRQTSEVEYPEYQHYPRERRDVLRLLAAGGAAAAASTMVGCDAVRDVLGMSRPEEHKMGKMVDPNAPLPTGDDDSADGAHPEGEVRGKMIQPQAEETPPATDPETVLKEGQIEDTHPTTRTGGVPKPPDPPERVEPEVRKKGTMVKPDAPTPPKLAGKPMPPKPPASEEEDDK